VSNHQGMTDTPWLGDACSLMDAFRSGERTPAEELELVLGAIERSSLNAVSFVDTDQARARAGGADVSKPFGGIPVGVKELDHVAGWPSTEASLVFKDRIASYTSTKLTRLVDDGGGILVGQTTASEFGGLNVSTTRLNGTTHNPWQHGRTAGGSSGGSAAAVAGGVFPLATGGDGGGSIRIPAAFNGLVGMKGTAGRIPRGPRTMISPLTVVTGCLSRSVRDVARFYDVCAGFDSRDPYSLPKVEGWERDLGGHDLAGKRVVIAPTLGSAIIRPEVEASVREAAEALVRDAGLVLVDLPVQLPGLGLEWAITNLATLRAELLDLWPECADLLSTQIAFGLDFADKAMNLEMSAKAELARIHANETMAAIFDEVDFVISATNPDVAYPAEVQMNTRVGDVKVGPENNGALTIPANICGNPAISIPVAPVDGLPVGMQVMGKHHEDALLLDLALVVERTCPWPLVVPSAPA
jgi:Asp-tRNA(Asn)/Glu-tRNA(Gln) amidotransferase A subunit family amidase